MRVGALSVGGSLEQTRIQHNSKVHDQIRKKKSATRMHARYIPFEGREKSPRASVGHNNLCGSSFTHRQVYRPMSDANPGNNAHPVASTVSPDEQASWDVWDVSAR